MAETGARVIVGSETQYFEGIAAVTGIQRVMREAHVTMTDVLSPHGISVVPMHTRNEPRRRDFRRNPYLASDPVLDLPPMRPEDVDAFVFLDLHAQADFSLVHRERRRRPRPVISLIHDIMPIHRPEWFVHDPQRTFRIYLQQLLAVSDHVVVTTDAVADQIRALGWRMAGELHVIGLGTTFRQREPEPAPDRRLSMMYVSTVEPRKGHDILLAAYDLLRAEGRDVDLTLVGREGWSCDDVVSAIRTHPDLGARIRWLLGADDLTVATLARNCSVGVFPSADEGFGLFLEEGLSYGLKMVVSDIPAFIERAQPNVSFSERTPSALAAAIVGAHESPWLPLGPGRVRTMQDFGRELAEVVRGSVA